MNDAMVQGDVNPRFFGPRACAVLHWPIRRAAERDRDFIMDLVREKYPDRPVELAVPWVEWCLTQADRLVCVGPNSFGVASALWHYGFERRGGMAILCCRPKAGASFEVLRMLRFMIAWAKEQGCAGEFALAPDAGIDFSPLAKRLGGISRTVWKVPLE